MITDQDVHAKGQDRRFRVRLRGMDMNNIPTCMFEQAEQSLGVWDTIEKCFVTRDAETGHWIPETAQS